MMPTMEWDPVMYATINGTGNTSGTTATWIDWNTSYTLTSATFTGTVTFAPSTWTGWNLVYSDGLANQTAQPSLLSPEEQERLRVAYEEANRRAREDAERRAAEQREAIAKAKALLESMLTSEQIAQLAANRWFEIISQKGHRYRINQGQSGNVHRYTKDGKYECRFCIHPGEYVPDEDAMLAQMLLLTTDEDSFVKIANRS